MSHQDNVKHFFGDFPVYIIHLKDLVKRHKRITEQFGDYPNLHIT